MISGAYVLDLCCDHPDHGSLRVGVQFTEESEGRAQAQAFREGWELDLIRRRAICPECVKK